MSWKTISQLKFSSWKLLLFHIFGFPGWQNADLHSWSGFLWLVCLKIISYFILWLYYSLYCWISFSMSSCILMVSYLELYLLYGTPSGAMMNFSKFHDTSFLVTGSQMISFGVDMICIGRSSGNGMLSLRNSNNGWALLPFTSIFENTGKFGSKPFPGRTYFSMDRISWSFPHSCKTN